MTAALFAYYFNPRPWLRDEIDERLRASIPADLNPDKTVGVPIRRSDKCTGHDIEGSARGEMVCSSLDEYLGGVKSFVAFDPSIENVIVTSEDKAACGEFVEMLKKELPALRVVVNVGDVQQGTGSGETHLLLKLSHCCQCIILTFSCFTHSCQEQSLKVIRKVQQMQL